MSSISSQYLNTPLLNTIKQLRSDRAQTQAADMHSINAILKERIAKVQNPQASRGTARLSLNKKAGPSLNTPVQGGLAAFMNAIAQIESGGRYNVVNSIGATGKYQILASNIPAWSKEALGYSVTPDQFRRRPKIQEAVARYKLGQYYRKYGAVGAAKAWNSGNPYSKLPEVADYVDKVLGILRSGRH